MYMCCVSSHCVPSVALLRYCVVFRVLFVFISSCSVKLVSGANNFKPFFLFVCRFDCLHSCGSSSAIKPAKWWSGSGLFLSPPRWQLFIVVLCRVGFSGSSFEFIGGESLEANETLVITTEHVFSHSQLMLSCACDVIATHYRRTADLFPSSIRQAMKTTAEKPKWWCIGIDKLRANQ